MIFHLIPYGLSVVLKKYTQRYIPIGSLLAERTLLLLFTNYYIINFSLMSNPAFTPSQKRNLAIATAIAVVVATYFLKNYLMLIAVAAIIAFSFNPLYQWLLRKTKSTGKSASLTLLISFITLLLPLGIILSLTITQLVHLLDSVDTTGINGNYSDLVSSFVSFVNNTSEKIGASFNITDDQVNQTVLSLLENISSSLINSFGALVSGIGSFVASFIIYIYVFLGLLINQEKLVNIFKNLNPLGKDISNLYIKRVKLMTKSMVKGQFIIAFVQGLTDTIFLYIVGFKSLFFFFLVILTILSIIPLGAGVIVFPIGFIMLLTGQVWQGLLLILGHMFIVGNEDNIMRPKLVPKEARLDPALTLLSVFSGLAFFGFFGIVLGPVLMIVIVTTIEVYLEVYKNIRASNKQDSSSISLMNKLKFWDRQQP